MTKHIRVQCWGLGILALLAVGCLGWVLVNKHHQNWSSTNVKAAYTIPGDHRTPLMRTYRKSEIEKLMPAQLGAIREKVRGKTADEKPLLVFHHQPQTLTFEFLAGNRVAILTREPTYTLTVIDVDDGKHQILVKGAMQRTDVDHYHATLVDLMPDAPLSSRYNVVADYLLAIDFAIEGVDYVTYTAFAVGH